jgi:hypothetical protein
VGDGDQRVLPGVSARTALRLAYSVLYLGIPLIGMAPVALVVIKVAGVYSPTIGIAVLVVFFGIILVGGSLVSILFPRARSIQRRELQAGYTTLMPEFDQVDGIDPKTGLVVRAARTPSARATTANTITTGAELGTVETHRNELQICLGTRRAVAWESLSLAILLGAGLAIAVFPGANAATQLVLYLMCFIAGSTALCIAAVVFKFAPIWYYMARLSEQAGGAPAFEFTLGNPNYAIELTGINAPQLPHARQRFMSYMVCEPDRLVMFSRHRTELIPFLLVPRSTIVDAHVGVAPNTQAVPVAAPILTVRKDNGTDLELVFTLTVRSWIGGRKQIRQDSQWIVDWALGKPSDRYAE